ncbi:MAG: helix-turn-helix domain-containing protein [Actinomycetota bacterium]|nr:helix-turn-helix domain-containing protein [Actinomycetota bacterium]
MNVGDLDNGPGRGQIGPLLEKKRLEKGLSLKEAEQATKIRTRYLKGLEREDPTALPDPVYARGFLKTYANFLGLDGEQLSREFRDHRAPRRERYLDYERPQRGEFDQPIINPGGVDDAERRRISGATIFTIVLAVLVLAVVIGALYYVGSRSTGNIPNNAPEEELVVEHEAEDDSLREEPAAGPESKTVAEDRADDASNEGSEAVQVTVRVVGVPTGLTVLTDGTVASDQFAQPGFSQTFEARRTVTISTANAGAVEVEVDGQNKGRLGQLGKPLTRDFTPQPGG